MGDSYSNGKQQDERAARKAANVRNGKPLKTVPDGSPRRMSDGKNAYRKMSPEQRFEFIKFMVEEDFPIRTPRGLTHTYSLAVGEL